MFLANPQRQGRRYGVCARAHGPWNVTELAEVPVDSGLVLVVDPGNVPPLVLRWLLTPNAQGITAGALLSTPCGDGWLTLDADGSGGLFGFMGAEEGDVWSVASDELRDIILGEDPRPLKATAR